MLYIPNIVMKMDQSYFWGFIFLFENFIQDYFLVWVIILNLGCFTCHCLHIDYVSLFYDFVYMVCLPFSQTHGLFVLYVVYCTTCLVFCWQKWGGAILAFHKFKYSTSPLNQLDNNFEPSSVKRLDLHLHSLVLHQLGY